jgi:hypothetical protein
MDLAAKYDKTNLLGDGEVKVWRGRERSRGTPVLLHTFTGNQKLLRLATEYLLRRPPSSPLLDIGEWDDATCLVTVSELDMLDVMAWLESAVTAPIAAPEPHVSTGPVPIPRADSGLVTKPATNPSPVSAPVSSPNPSPQGPGEFTRAFQIPRSNVPPQHMPDPLAGSGPTPKPAGPGEFTRAFQLPGSNVPPQHLPDPMAPSGPAKPAGEFTRLFQLPGQAGNREPAKAPELGLPPSPPDFHPPTAPPAAPSVGEFTRLFRAQPNPNPPGELPPEPVAPRMNIATGPVPLPQHSAPPAPKGPGEYTRVMQTPSLQGPPPQASASPSPASAQAVQLPISVTPPSIPSVSPSVPAPPVLPTPQVPYVQASIPVPQAPSVQAPSLQAPNVQVPAPAPRSGISPVVLLLGGLILVAVILVLIFALRR